MWIPSNMYNKQRYASPPGTAGCSPGRAFAALNESAVCIHCFMSGATTPNNTFLKFLTLLCLRRRVRNGHARTSRRKRRLLSSVAVSSFPTSDDVAGWLPEKMGEKRVLGNVWCIPHLILGDNRIYQNSYRTNTPYRSLTTRRPSYRNQI